MTTKEIDVEFPVGRPRLKGGGAEVITILKCETCGRTVTKLIYVKTYGEKRVFGCRLCGEQRELEVRPKRYSYI